MENGTDDREREEKEQEREVIDFYQVGKNIFVMIYREGSRIFYRPIEPELSEKELEALSAVKDYVMKRLYFTHRDLRERWTKLQQDVEEKVKEANDVLLLKLDSPSLSKISYYVKRDYLGYERIDVLMNDPFIEDISSSGPGIPIYVYHIKYGWLPTTVIFPSEESYTAFIRRLAYRAGQDLVFATPIVEGPLPPKNYRAHLVLDVISRSGSSFTIRRGAEVPLSIVRLIILRTLSPRMAAYIWLLISHMRTILIAGPMASGKTTLLNAIIMFIPPAKKIVSIEETNELRLDRENWVPLIVRPSTSPGISNITLYELLKSSLRQRPDYIVVGEVRGEEAYTFFQAISLGHGGLGTIHAESFQQIIRRLESQPLNIPRSM
ncbi:MAG: type II/IV secretion system ATPase subunit, partial [Fervidicoccaceae archaeon]